MRVFGFGWCAAIAVLGSVVPVFAQRVPVEGQQPPARIAVRGEVSLLAPEAVDKLKFTADQKEKFAKIDAEFKEKLKATQDKIREDIKAGRDREKIKEAQEKLQVAGKKVRDVHLGKVEPILTAEQKTVFAQVKDQPAQRRPQPDVVRPVLPAAGVGQVLPAGVQQRLNLTDEQKKQIADIQKDVDAKILKVLTEEQRTQYENMKKVQVRPLPQPIRPVPPAPGIRNPQPRVEPAPERKD